MAFLQVLQFPPTSQKRAGGLTGDSKLPLYAKEHVKVCVHGAEGCTVVPWTGVPSHPECILVLKKIPPPPLPFTFFKSTEPSLLLSH